MNAIEILRNSVKKIGTVILDLILPPDLAQRALESREDFSHLSPFKAGRKTVYPWVSSFFDYSDRHVRKAIWELKYRKNKKVITLFSDVIVDKLLSEMADIDSFENFKNPLLISIPLSKERERKRGYNQCALILKEVEKRETGIEISFTALEKVRNTKPQTLFSKKADRVKNLSGAFAANAPEVSGRNILLLDDVTTTGSTLTEARRTLLESGAKKVIAWTLAH